jgi:DNA-binding IclR family transcriptional regulator
MNAVRESTDRSREENVFGVEGRTPPMSDEPFPVGATATAMGVIGALADRGEAGVSELARELDLSKSAVHKHLTTLERLEYVTSEDGRYRLRFRFLGIGLDVRDRLPLYRIARPAIDNLSQTTGEITNLMVPEHARGVYVHQADAGRDPDEPLRAGHRVPLHATAGGKAILAHLPGKAVDAVVDRHGLPALTEKTTTDPDDLRRELRSVRDRGLAFDRGEHRSDWQCVAAPVLADDRPIGAITVSGPIARMSGKTLEEAVAGLVVSTSNAVEVAYLSEEPVR